VQPDTIGRVDRERERPVPGVVDGHSVERDTRRVEAVESARLHRRGGDPYGTRPILVDTDDGWMLECPWVVSIDLEDLGVVGIRSEEHQTAVGPEPQPAPVVLVPAGDDQSASAFQTRDGVTLEAERAPIQGVEAVLGAHPQHATAILEEDLYGVV